jgi:hypothetical protein
MPQESADLLLKLYSGGPTFPRKVKFADAFNDRSMEVDLWPVRVSLYLCDRSHPTPDPLQPLSQRRFFPSGMTLQEAVTLVERHLFHIAMYTPTRCWLHETPPQSNSPASGTGRRLTNDIVEWDGGWHVTGSAAMSRRLKDIRGDGDCIEMIIEVAPCPNPKPSDWPRFHLLEAWKQGLSMGDMFDARDAQGHFKAATVAHVSEAGDLVVRYWTGGDDEWILASDFDRRIAPLHSHRSASSVPEVDMTAPSTLVTHPRSSEMPPATSDDDAGGSAIEEDHGASQVAKVNSSEGHRGGVESPRSVSSGKGSGSGTETLPPTANDATVSTEADHDVLGTYLRRAQQALGITTPRVEAVLQVLRDEEVASVAVWQALSYELSSLLETHRDTLPVDLRTAMRLVHGAPAPL